MQTQINKIVIILFVIMLITACGGGGSGVIDDPNLNINGASGSIKFGAIEDDTSTMTVPLSYLITSTETFEEEFQYLRMYVLNKTQDRLFIDYAAEYYSEDSEEQMFFFTINQGLVMDISPVSDGDEIAVVMVHTDDSWEKYAVTLRDDESVSVSPYSGEDAYAQNESEDYTSAEELWCYFDCESCSGDLEVFYGIGGGEGASPVPGSFTEGVCSEE